MTDSEFRTFYFEHLKWCGCGEPQAGLGKLRTALQHAAARKAAAPDDESSWFVLYALDSWKLTEHGTTISFGWLTDLGVAVLAYLATNMDRVGDVLSDPGEPEGGE